MDIDTETEKIALGSLLFVVFCIGAVLLDAFFV